MRLPCRADGGIVLRINAVHTECEIGAPGDFVERCAQSRVLRRHRRIPCVEKSENRPRGGALHTVQNRVVQLRRRLKTLAAARGLPLLIDAQQISGVVPEKVGRDAGRAFYRRGQNYLLRPLDGLFPGDDLLHSGDDLYHRAVFVETKREADLRGRPARCGDFPAREQILIIARQSLQNHPCTSPLSGGGTVTMPSVMTARKNRGRMSCGSP